MSRLALTVALLSACLPGVAPAQPEPGSIVANEIMYAPDPSSNEFIELYNTTDEPVRLGDLQFADANRSFGAVTDLDTSLAAGAYVVLARDPEAFRSAFPEVTFLVPDDWDALNNGGDTVYLRHGPSGAPLDSVAYEPSWGGDDGRSLERIDPRGSGTRASNFATSTATAGATPGRQNSQFAPNTDPPAPTFAEMVDATIAHVLFDEPVRPETVTAPAFDLDGTSVTEAALESDRVARVTFGEEPSAARLRVRGVQDLVGNEIESATVPLAYRPSPSALAINEIMFAPLADDFDDRPNQVEYVELFNVSERPLTLSRLVLTDRPTEEGVADTLRVGRRRAVLPDGFALLAAAPDGATRLNDSQIADAFPNLTVSSDSIAYLPVDAEQIGLRNDGDLVRLHRGDGTVVGDVSYSPDWHSSSLAETKGTALARISPTGEANAADNWTSSTAAAGGTPGAPNAVSLALPDDAPNAPGLTVEPSPFSIERDGVTRIQYSLQGVPNLVRARIFDARGRKVRTLEEARLTGQSGELVWNGRDDAGDRVRIGIYVILLEAVRADAGETVRLKETVVLARPLN